MNESIKTIQNLYNQRQKRKDNFNDEIVKVKDD